MKKTLLIIGGSIIILGLIALWVYLLFFGTPRNVNEVFTSFGDSGADVPPDSTPTPETPAPSTPVVNIFDRALRQLTTRPVIGYREVQTSASATPYVYYAEAGTGHIFSINLTTGEESRISGTTMAEAVAADFSDDGQFVVLQSGYGRVPKTAIGTLGTTSAVAFSDLSEEIADFSITRNNELLYTVKGAVTTGRALSLSTRAARTIFTLPFRDATVVWGSTAASPHYIYPKSSYLLEGFLYVAKNSALDRVPLSGYGFNAAGFENLVVANYLKDTQPTTYFGNTKTNRTYRGSFITLSEKCAFSLRQVGNFWCAGYTGPVELGFPDTWYRGEAGSRDIIYAIEVSADAISTTNLVDTFSETSREVDAVGMRLGKSEDNLYFMNKNDNTLWMYDLSL